jgi:hypothetical protein
MLNGVAAKGYEELRAIRHALLYQEFLAVHHISANLTKRMQTLAQAANVCIKPEIKRQLLGVQLFTSSGHSSCRVARYRCRGFDKNSRGAVRLLPQAYLYTGNKF